MVRGGAYALAGGKTKASIIIQAPKNKKIRGKAEKALDPLKNMPRMTPPRIMRKTLAFSGAQGRRFILPITSP
jgi:hypothetical protein